MSEQGSSAFNTVSVSTLVRVALRLLWRDWRGGELRLLLLAMIMAVTSVSGIALFTDRLERALLQESANMLAADRVLGAREQPPRELLSEAGQRGLETAEYIAFASMVFSDQANLLVAAKAVSDAYPLRGSLQIADQAFGQAYLAEQGGPARGEVWVECVGRGRCWWVGGDPLSTFKMTSLVLQRAAARKCCRESPSRGSQDAWV
jgi:putative ABC transport system permease protein